MYPFQFLHGHSFSPKPEGSRSLSIALLTFAAAVFMQGFASQAGATTYYVSPTGSDSNSGQSQSSPYRNVVTAVNAARAGDTIYLMDGTYDGTNGYSQNISDGSGCYYGCASPVHISKAGTSSAPITMRSLNRWGATLDCGTTSSRMGCDNFIDLDSGAAYWVFQDIVFTRGAMNGVGFNSGSGANHLTFQGNRFEYIGNWNNQTQIGEDGLGGDSSVSYVTINGNIFHDIGRTYQVNLDHGIYAEIQHATVTNNIFYNIPNGWSLQIAHGANDWLIANNTFGTQDDPQGGAVMLYNGNSNITIENNIFYNVPNYAVMYYSESISGCTISNNLVYGASTVLEPGLSGCTVSNNITGKNPNFVNASSYNYQLNSGSPAIGAGLVLSQVTTDFNGASRGSTNDIGAYQYGSTSGGTPTPVTSSSETMTLSTSSVSFGSQLVGTTSAVQYVTLTNTGSGSITLPQPLTMNGTDFAFAGLGTCGSSLAAGSNCTVSVEFKPTATGTRTGSVVIADSAAGSPHTISLTGVGTSTSAPAPTSTPTPTPTSTTKTGAAASLSATSLTFGSQTVGTTSAVQYITLTNTGTATLTLPQTLTMNGADFAFAGLGSCGTSLAAGSNCTYSVKFTPTATGTRTGSFQIVDNAPDSPQTITLTGTGASAASTNLVQNPGFENGLTSWSNWGNSTVVTYPVHSGSHALKVGTGSGGVGQNITGLTPGKTYTLTVYAYMNSPSAQFASVQIAYQDSSGNDISGYEYYQRITSSSWAQYTISAPAPSSFSSVQVRVWNNAGSSYVYVDDFNLH